MKLIGAIMLVFVAATTASAECAWVFWQEEISPYADTTSTWAVSAWKMKDECEKALAKKIMSDTTHKSKNTEVMADELAGKPRVWMKTKGREDLTIAYTYVCLPDTVDPRRVKGK